MRYLVYVLLLAICLVVLECTADADKGETGASDSNTAKESGDATTEGSSNSKEEDPDTTTSTEAANKPSTGQETETAGTSHANLTNDQSSGGGNDNSENATGSITSTGASQGQTQDSSASPVQQEAVGESEHMNSEEIQRQKEVRSNSINGQHGESKTKGSQERTSVNDTGASAEMQVNANSADQLKSKDPGEPKSGQPLHLTTPKDTRSSTSTETDMNDQIQGNPDSSIASKAPPSTDASTTIMKRTDLPTSPDLLNPTVLAGDDKTPKVPLTGGDGKFTSTNSVPTESKTLPLHHSVDKTDGSLCSSSLFALAALATLAVAAAAPAH